ncbi:MAG: ABC transporter permease [Planctomycetes bacterium]|nr:ABC transporter permease [Planctomycetota bacterium]
MKMIAVQAASYFADNRSAYLAAVGEHIIISAAALVIALALAFPAGCLSVRYAGLRKACLTVFNTLRIIPSLAVLLLLLPILGTGPVPAVVALALLAMPPILLNTIAGLDGVPAFMLETAAGVGMTRRQSWLRVRIPLALPLVMTGVRIAVIEIIASATLAAKIGAGGLGEIIFTGLGLARTDLLLIGGVSVALLSLGSGLLFSLPGRFLFRYNRSISHV